jgi:hypothetical protein
MKTALKSTGVFLLLCPLAFAEWQVGRGALKVDADGGIVYDSNIRSSASEQADTYVFLHPTLHYRRHGARFKLDGQAGVRVLRYFDQTIHDSENPHASLDWNMARVEGHTTAAHLQLNYRETTQALPEINEIVKTRDAMVGVSGEVLVAQRNLLNAALSYRDVEHDIGSDRVSQHGRLGYTYVGFTDGTTFGFDYARLRTETTDNTFSNYSLDQTSDTVSARLARPIYAGLTGSVSYGYRWLDRGEAEAVLGLPSRDGSFVSATLNGSFLPKQYFPKTTGRFRIGYEQAESPGLNDNSSERLVGSIEIDWQARPNTSVGVYVRRTQDLGIDDNTIVNSVIGFNLSQNIGSFLKAQAEARYSHADFVNLNREDDRYEVELSARYEINRRWSARGSIRYLRSNSTFEYADYDRVIVSLSASYAF